jgi:peroxiredoxin
LQWALDRCFNRRPGRDAAKRRTNGPATLLAKGPVVVTVYRGGWCPFCNLELKAYQAVLPRIAAAGASIVAISPERPDNTVSTAEKNALSFPVLSDVGQAVGKAFGVVDAFTDDLRSVYEGFKLDIPVKYGVPDDWSLPLSATYVIGVDGVVLFADTRVDYRERNKSVGGVTGSGASRRSRINARIPTVPGNTTLCTPSERIVGKSRLWHSL